MKVDSLDELKFAFAEWRNRKKHARELTPSELLARARRATDVHGVAAVVRVTRVERARIFRITPGQMKAESSTTKKKDAASSVPAFSRLDLGAPPTPGFRPIVEVETGTGVKLRVFEQTPEMLGLLSTVCGFGGAQ